MTQKYNLTDHNNERNDRKVPTQGYQQKDIIISHVHTQYCQLL